LGRDVVYVQNVTDIDDSILARARELGLDWRRLGNEETRRYLEDMHALNVADPDELVLATSCMPTILEMIDALLAREAAYRIGDGSVFFRIAARPTYGELSRLSRDEMLVVAGQQDDSDVDDARKEDPLDFALWRGWSGRDDEPWWDTPWGRGRPGWHIECSAVILRHHGPQITVHGGGVDLVYPHHESEIAQSEAATGVRPLARLWMHAAMTRMDGEKMSKSLGNMVFVRDLLTRYDADAIRLYLLSHHVRGPFEWSEAGLVRAAETLDALRRAAHRPDEVGDAQKAFRAALEDDLDTPAALRALGCAAGQPLRDLAGILGLRLGT
ncbi:MAG: class I tRNA ligase family protein, partial [Chloroflexi bacterium]|nr:class I tRNA ligase family protein [Chloroflexota bacterium]